MAFEAALLQCTDEIVLGVRSRCVDASSLFFTLESAKRTAARADLVFQGRELGGGPSPLAWEVNRLHSGADTEPHIRNSRALA